MQDVCDQVRFLILNYLKERASSVWRKLFDLTYPFTALFYGHEFNRGIWKVFLDTHVEDCWIPFFCNTTNITFQRMEVHRFGMINISENHDRIHVAIHSC